MEKAAEVIIVLAEDKEPTVAVPLVLAPIQVQIPLAIPSVETRDVPVAARIHPGRSFVRYTICTTALRLLSELYLIPGR